MYVQMRKGSRMNKDFVGRHHHDGKHKGSSLTAIGN